MESILSNTTVLAPNINVSISLLDLSLSFVLALILGIVVMIVYRLVNISASYDNSYEFSLVIIPTIVCVVMVFIGSNLALSIGMVGSLSIIRFRTVIKNTMDMVFLFWAIAIGLGCGTYNWIVTIYFVFILAFVIFLLNFWKSKINRDNFSESVLVVNTSPDFDGVDIRKEIIKFYDNFKLRSIDKSAVHNEFVYNLADYKIIKNNQNLETLVDNLKNMKKVNKVSILSPQLDYSN